MSYLFRYRLTFRIEVGYRIAEFLESGFDHLAVADDHDRHLRWIQVPVGNAIHIVDRYSVDLRYVIVKVRVRQAVGHEVGELVRNAADGLKTGREAPYERLF